MNRLKKESNLQLQKSKYGDLVKNGGRKFFYTPFNKAKGKENYDPRNLSNRFIVRIVTQPGLKPNTKNLKRNDERIEESRPFKRLKLNCEENQIEGIQNLCIYPDVAEKIAAFLNLKDLLNLSFVSKEHANLVYNFILPSLFWIQKITEAYKFSVHAADAVQSEKILKLRDRTIQILPTKESQDSFLLTKDLKQTTTQSLKEYVTDYANYIDDLDLLLEFFSNSKNKFIRLTYAERAAYLALVNVLCNSNNINNHFGLCHARKIIEYFLYWEDAISLHKKAINLLFKGLTEAISHNKEKEVTKWLTILDNSFYRLDSVEMDLWFNKSLVILKRNFYSSCQQETKKMMLDLIEKHLSNYLYHGKRYIFKELIVLRQSPGLTADHEVQVNSMIEKFKSIV